MVLSSSEPRLRGALEAASFKVFFIEGARISDKATFFEESARALEFPSWFGHNWDAFVDLLSDVGEGLERIGVIWREADRLLLADTQVFLDAVLCLGRWAEDLSDHDEPVQVEVFLLGQSPGFETKP